MTKQGRHNIRIATRPMNKGCKRSNIITNSNRTIPFRLHIRILMATIPSLDPIGPFLTNSVIVLPYLMRLLLRLNRNATMTFRIRRLFRVNKVQSSTICRNLMLHMSFFLPLSRINTKRRSPLRFCTSTALMNRENRLCLPFIVCRPTQGNRSGVRVRFPNALKSIPIAHSGNRLIRLRRNRLFAHGTIAFNRNSGVFRSQAILPNSFFKGKVTYHIQYEPLTNL